MSSSDLIVVGGGLAGCEAAWQAAQRGLKVILYEMRPDVTTGAHTSPDLAELVCSNSFGTTLPDKASGLLKQEIRKLNSLLLECAYKTALPSGSALAVDREGFSRTVTERLYEHKNITVMRKEIAHIPEGMTVIASGPLTSARLSKSLSELFGEKHLFFFDAIAPVVILESVNMDVTFPASRYQTGEIEEGDYINCPLEKDEYDIFIDQLLMAERIPLHDFEGQIEAGVTAGDIKYFEGCLPVEIIAQRGKMSLAFGPMRPTGIINPHTGRKPFAIVQLRRDNQAGTLYNLVGFQTNLKIGEQKRVFRLIPGLESVEFARYGQMHRNTFIAAPNLLLPTLQYRGRHDLFFAGQIIGVEGYLGNIATGLLAGINAARIYMNQKPIELPQTSLVGALCYYVTHANKKDFQPMKANFGILPPIQGSKRISRQVKAKIFSRRSLSDLEKIFPLIEIS